MADGRDRPPKILPPPRRGTLGSTFVDPRDVGIDPATGVRMNTNAHSDPTPAHKSARQRRRSAQSSPSVGAGPSTEAGSSTRTDLSTGASPSAGAGPSGAARPQPALPDVSKRVRRANAPTTTGPSRAARPQPALPDVSKRVRGDNAPTKAGPSGAAGPQPALPDVSKRVRGDNAPTRAGPSRAARPQPALPNVSKRVRRDNAPTKAGPSGAASPDVLKRLHRRFPPPRAAPSPGAGPSGAAQPQPAIPSNIPTHLPLPDRGKHRPEGPAIVECPHSTPQPGLDEPIERSPPVQARGQGRAPASGSTIRLLPAYTKGRPADPSSRWESMLVEQAREEERILEETVVEFIRLDKGQPPLDPAYEGLNWGETFKAASTTLEVAMRKIKYCEGELRLLGVSTRSPGPDRFRLHRIPSRLHLPARGDPGPRSEYRRPRSAGGDGGAAGGAAGGDAEGVVRGAGAG